ncbi:hypothetical protein BH24DEI2_BH24DEI2_14840 [soil metagenome]
MRRLLVFLSFVLLTSCTPYRQPVQRVAPLEPIQPLVFEVVPGQTAVERFDPPGAGAVVELSIGLQVKNPNVFGVTLARVAYDVVLAGKAVSTAEVEPGVFIAAGEQAPLKIRVTASLEGETELIRAVAKAFSTTPLPFRLDGVTVFASRSHEVRTARRTLVVGATMARELVTPPALRLVDAQSRVFLLRAGAPVIQLSINAENTGGIGYFLSGQEVHVFLGGQDLGAQDLALVPVPAAQGNRFDLLFYPQPERLDDDAQAALNAALQGIPTLLELRGDLLLDVLGVDTYRVADGLNLSGFVYNTAP